MGCGSSAVQAYHHSAPGEAYIVEVNEVWVKALKTVKPKKMNKKIVIKRKGWRTIRIFVSSTFKDFHQEREQLIKKIFPDLRAWCEARKLYLVECDLRWGVPKDFTTEATLRACLGEIDRCYQDNVMPFFLNMTSERVGWVPVGDEVPEAIREEYQWIEGLSVTEMEIMHGAYRIENPNALFMVRDMSFIQNVPEEHRKLFVEGSTIAPTKLMILKKMIAERFSKRTCTYKVEVLGYNPETKQVELGGFDKTFSTTIYNFFKSRIAEQYPMEEGELDPFLLRKEQEEAFMKSRCQNVIGRESMIKMIDDYICGMGNDVPMLLLGGAGSGKSSLMAKAADDAVQKAATGSLPGGSKEGWHVFYHFVGAVPGSTELLLMLQRLLKELGAVTDSTIPSDLESATQLTCSTLANPLTRPCVVIVDALNQFDEELPAQAVTWSPKKLAPHVRCIFSMINDTTQHKSLINREPKPQELLLLPLTENDRMAIVNELLGRYTKQLDGDQMSALLSKTSSENPLWLSIACEELRVFGMFRQISDKINSLPDGLLELEQMVFQRFEVENGGELLVATLCLLEVSARGLLETELLTILGDEDNLMPTKGNSDGENKEKEDKGKEKSPGQLPAYKWAEIYRGLRKFLRPFGDSGEGRLDFYHRSLSKAVRIKYFKGNEEEKKYKWWHSKLADFFEKKCTNIHRKIEELPVHLIANGQHERLEMFLTDWSVFDVMFDEEYSMKLLAYWRKGSNLGNMETAYLTKIKNLKNDETTSEMELCMRYEHIARLFAQGGRYDEAIDLSAKALDLEETKLGARPKKMADLFFLKAQVLDEVMKLQEYMYRSQLPKMKEIIDLFNEAVKLFKTLSGDDTQRKKGRIYNRLAFYYSGYAIRGGDNYIDSKTAKEKAVENIDMAIAIFDQLDDQINVADCIVTKAVTYGSCCPEQLKCYKEGEEILLRLTGGLHHFLDRLYLNFGIYFEEAGDYNAAYDFFHKWYLLCCDLYGKAHPKSKRPVNTLCEPMYRRIATERNIEIPEVIIL